MSQFEVRMQEASRQLFELVEAEYAEEERIASLAQEGIEEGVPPSPPPAPEPQSTIGLPVRLHYSFTCCCHEIDWLTPLKNGGQTIYNYTDGTPCIQCTPIEGHGMPCGDRVNLCEITVDQAEANCRYYNWSDPNTKMPRDLIDFFHKWNRDNPYDSRLDIDHPDHYLNHYSSLEDLINHLKEPDLFPFSPILGTNSFDDAQRDIEQIQILKYLDST